MLKKSNLCFVLLFACLLAVNVNCQAIKSIDLCGRFKDREVFIQNQLANTLESPNLGIFYLFDQGDEGSGAIRGLLGPTIHCKRCRFVLSCPTSFLHVTKAIVYSGSKKPAECSTGSSLMRILKSSGVFDDVNSNSTLDTWEPSSLSTLEAFILSPSGSTATLSPVNNTVNTYNANNFQRGKWKLGFVKVYAEEIQYILTSAYPSIQIIRNEEGNGLYQAMVSSEVNALLSNTTAPQDDSHDVANENYSTVMKYFRNLYQPSDVSDKRKPAVGMLWGTKSGLPYATLFHISPDLSVVKSSTESGFTPIYAIY